MPVPARCCDGHGLRARRGGEVLKGVIKPWERKVFGRPQDLGLLPGTLPPRDRLGHSPVRASPALRRTPCP
jgi:hypothetical protein